MLVWFALFVASNAFASSYSGLGLESISKETLAKYAPSPLESSLRRKIQNFLDLRAPGMGLVRPGGSELFFSWSISGVPQIWKLKAPQAFPTQFTGGEDPAQLSAITPDGKYLIVSRDRNGEENPGVYLQSVSGGPLVQVFHKPKVRASAQFVSDDSRYLYFGANEPSADSIALYRYEFESKKIEMIFNEPGLWGIVDYSPKQKLFLLEKSTGSRSSEFFTWSETERKLAPVIGQGEKTEYTVHFSAHEGEYLVLTDKIGDFRRLYSFKSGKLTPITPEMKKDVSSFSIDYPRTRVIYEINDDGYTRIQGMSAKDYKPIQLPNLPKDADHVISGSTTRDGRYTTFGVITSKSPRVSYVYDWKSKKLVQWVVASTPEIDTKSFAVSKLEYYTTRDGVKIPMFVRRSQKCQKESCPVVVHFHGGPEGQSTPGFSVYAQIFVDAGFIFVEPNVRGSDGYGKSWLDSDNGPKRLNVITDIEDCSKFIRENWAVKGQKPKIGVMGWSYGGYSTLMAMTRFAGSYDAGVALVGMSNLVSFLKNTAPYRRALRVTEYGDPDKDEEALKKLSPINYVSEIRHPLLIIQGANDPRVPAGEAIQIQEAARKKGIDTGLILFADEGHGASKRENQVLELGHTVNFFLKYLK